MAPRREVSGPGQPRRPRRAAALPDDFAEAVLEVVAAIPPGRVLSYGDVAEYLGVGGPRSVGRVLSTRGSGVPWWRVLRADGSVADGLQELALPAYVAEGTPLRAGGTRVDMPRARWDG